MIPSGKQLDHTSASSLREQYIEHVFLGAISQEVWRRNIEMDVLRSHTDQSGYDILLDAMGIQRHIQLKSSFDGAKTSRQKINIKLSSKPGGCVVWMRFDETDLSLTSFLWLGERPGEPLSDLGDKVAKHSKGNASGFKAERSSIRVLNKGDFTLVDNVSDLVDLLFGVAPS